MSTRCDCHRFQEQQTVNIYESGRIISTKNNSHDHSLFKYATEKWYFLSVQNLFGFEHSYCRGSLIIFVMINLVLISEVNVKR